MTLWRLYISIFWRLLVFVCIFIIVHYLRRLDVGITVENYIYWAFPFILWAEFGIRILLKNENKIEHLCSVRKTPFVVTVVAITNFIFVNLLTPLVFGVTVPLIINAAFAVLFFHGELGTFAMVAPEESGKRHDELQFETRCPMCGHYLGHRLGTFEKCPACGIYGPFRRGGCVVMLQQFLWTAVLFVVFLQLDQPIEKSLHVFGGETTKLYPIVVMISGGFVFYYMARLWLSAITKNNTVFKDTVRKYWWRFVLALVVSITVGYLGKKYGLLPYVPK